MLSGSAETLGKKISASARVLLESDMGDSPDSRTVPFTTETCVGAFMIFCGGLVMAIDDEMPLAVEALAETVGQSDTMGICCFGEQGMNNLRKPMHGNLMFGALLFSTTPRFEPTAVPPSNEPRRVHSMMSMEEVPEGEGMRPGPRPGPDQRK
mmetsp:Transcript_31964/g.55006  ORF Transcript_31964/g.55006 Transcript_31964/m.55006 type:complete len:153 (+) Transcript_31964:3-461(+)